MAKRKLTNKLKEKIKESPYRLRKEDFTGEALAYLNRVRGAAKGRKAKAAIAESKLIINGKEVPKQSNTYKLVAAAAQMRKMPLKKFVTKYAAETEKFVKNDRFYQNTDVEEIKKDVNKTKAKIFVNGKQVSKAQLKYRIGRLKGKLINTLDIYDKVLIEHYFDGHANIHFDIPEVSDYADIDDPEELEDFIETHYSDTITFYKGGKGKSKKSHAKTKRN